VQEAHIEVLRAILQQPDPNSTLWMGSRTHVLVGRLGWPEDEEHRPRFADLTQQSLVYSPLASGLLGRRGERLPTLVDGRDLPERRRLASLIDQLTMIADTVGLDVVRLAIAWTLSVDGVTGAICGARTREQVDGWAEAVDVTLDAVVLDQIRSVISAPQSDD
jgi:aryl-alcohol dehydrogenase-like predicted oxidoreductase